MASGSRRTSGLSHNGWNEYSLEKASLRIGGKLSMVLGSIIVCLGIALIT